MNKRALSSLFILIVFFLPLLKAQTPSDQIQAAKVEGRYEPNQAAKKLRHITSGLDQKLRQAPAETFLKKVDFHYGRSKALT